MGPIEEKMVTDFVELLLRRPHETMLAIQLRLAYTDYELKLLEANPLKSLEKDWEPFPIKTAERSFGGW